VARHGSVGAVVHPDVVTGAVSQESGAVALEPALELSSFHSGDAVATMASGGSGQAAELFGHLVR